MQNQTLITVSLVLIVALVKCTATPVIIEGSETTKPALEPRWLISFAQFIWYYTRRNPLDYNNYGCWCGIGRIGTNTVDAIDECCKAHDACYQNIGYLGINSICLGDSNSKGYKACICDRTAAECFAAHEYNPHWKNRCE